MTDRLTLRDWQIINGALALFEADVPCDEEGIELEDEALDAWATEVENTRAKVHQRLKERY